MPVPRGATLDPARTREAIVRAATEVLYERGLDGVGVAELCAGMGVSKETLYRHFGSKDGLIDAVLRARSDRVTGWLRAAVLAADPEPSAQLAAVFDALGSWYAEPGFRGCAILNGAVQHHVEPATSVATRHLDRRLELLAGIAARAGVLDPGGLGRQWLMLVVGATVVADHHDARGAAEQAKQAALALLGAAQRPGPPIAR